MNEDPNTEENRIIDRRRNGYEEVERKLDEHAEEIRMLFRKWFIIGLIAFSIIAVSSGVALIGYGLVLRSQADFTRDIQEQRREATLDACQETNERNEATKKALEVGSTEDQRNAPDDAARQEIRRRVAVTIALIDALVPHKDCQKLVTERVQGKL